MYIAIRIKLVNLRKKYFCSNVHKYFPKKDLN